MRPNYRISALQAIWPALAMLAAVAMPTQVQANWLSKLVRETGETGAKVSKYDASALDDAVRHIETLPGSSGSVAIAVHATPEGHWKFVNQKGEIYTAGTAAELIRFTETLAPELGAAKSKLTLFLSEDTVFTQRALIKDLPAAAELHAVTAAGAYRIVSRSGAGGIDLFAEVRPNIIVELGHRELFDEAVWQLATPLRNGGIRLLALEPGGPAVLPRLPRYDRPAGSALVDAIDPRALAAALAALRGQTVLITGRTEGKFLYFKPASGPERSLVTQELTAAAEAADVNLIILHANAPRQPGGRNWLWQRVEVSGLGEALRRATYADFITALGANRGQFIVKVSADGPSRAVLTANPSGSLAVPGTGVAVEWLTDAVSGITGNVVTNAIEAHLRSAERQRELDRRILPGIPSDVQLVYLGLLVIGVMGLGPARKWWARIWPAELRREYGSAAGYYAARVLRFMAFAFVFLPVVAIPAALATIVFQLWALVIAPFRVLRRVFQRFFSNSRVPKTP